MESSTFLIMTFPEIVESKDLLWGRTCAVDNVRARRKGILGKLYEIQISPERGLRNSLKYPSYFGMEYVRPWNMGKKLLELWSRPAAGNPPQCYPPPQEPPRGGLISYAILTCWPHATFIYTTLQDTSITPHPSQRVGFGSTLHRASYIQRTCRTMTMTWGVGFGGGVLAWAIYI